MDKVKLYQAFIWTCPECETEQFQHACTQELTPDERVRLANINDIDPEEMTGELVAMPEHVTCVHCDQDFEVDFDGQDVIEGVDPEFPDDENEP